MSRPAEGSAGHGFGARPGGTLFRGGRWITMDAEDRVFDGEMFVVDGRIEALGPKLHVPDATPVVDLTGAWITPGFIQGHVHLGQTLFRGLGENRRLLDWLKEVIWPLEAAHDDRSARAAARLGGSEALRAGTTAILDIGLVRGMNGLIEGLIEVGLRAWTGKLLMDRGEGAPAALLDTPAAAMEESRELARRWGGVDNGRIRYAVCPRFVYSCSHPLWEAAVDQARAGDFILHTHAFETREEQAATLAIEGTTELESLERVGALTVPLKVAHGVWVDEASAERLGAAGSAVIHCPASNLKLGSGVADLAMLRRHGVRLGLGCDGSPCNNFLDPLAEMRLSALLQKWRRGPDAWSGRDSLALATIDGARALGADGELGSLEVGKRADFVVFDLERIHSTVADAVDPYTRIVFGADRTNIRSVWIDGRLVAEEGRVVGLDDAELIREARAALTDLLRRAEAG